MRLCSRPARWSLVFGLLILVALAAPVRADFTTLDLTLVPATAQYNTMDLTLEVSVSGSGSVSDDDTSIIAGNVLADITYTAPPAAYDADVTGLAFTGGRVTFSDVTFFLSFGILGSISADGTDLAGYPDTPVPPGTVTAGQFPTEQHEVVMDEGSFEVLGSGLVGGFLTPNPMTFDLNTTPLSGTTTGTGTLAVSAPVIVGNLATYDVMLTMPVAFDEEVYNDGTIAASIVASGMLRATGQFTHVIPEPATLALVLAGAAALGLRRRR